jgi:hypothetical protein
MAGLYRGVLQSFVWLPSHSELNMTFLAFDIGNTRLKWTVDETATPGADLTDKNSNRMSPNIAPKTGLKRPSDCCHSGPNCVTPCSLERCGSHNPTMSSRLTKAYDDLRAMLQKLGTGLFVVKPTG